MTGILAILSLCAAVLVSVGTAPAQAVQAPGDDVAAWNTGWNWTWATTFRYQADGTDVTINETVKYTVAGRETFQGQDAYKLNITGTIDSGSGSVAVDGVGNATLSNFSGDVSGTRYVRVSDLALLQEYQDQNMRARAQVSIVSQNITANIKLRLTPQPGWRVHNFPLNAGDNWQTDTDVEYEGGFTYDAGSLGGTGNSPFGPDTLEFDAPSVVTSEVITTPIASNVTTKKVTSVNADASMSDVSWWSPTYKNQLKEIMVLPLDGGKVTLTRNMKAASIPSGAQFSATATPSLTCAGNDVVVSGNLSSGTAGVPVTVKLDKSPVLPGQAVTATGTTGTNGAYSVSIPTPGDSDGFGKNGSRANWGISVTSPANAAIGATTVVVTPVNCSALAYTGATSGPVSGSSTVSATLTDKVTGPSAGKQITFQLGGGGSVTATTNASGVATATLPMNGPVRSTTVTASYAGSAGLAAASASSPFAVQVNPTSTTVLPSQSNVTIGDDVTFTATVTPGVGANPTGNVQFLVNGAAFGQPRPVSGGTATSAALNTNLLGLGFHTVEAVYNGDASFATSASDPVTFRVRVPLLPSATSLSVAPTSTVYGQQVTLSSTVTVGSGSGTPTGSVTFSSGGTALGTVPVDGSGNAVLTTTTVPVGNHSIVATYSGDDEYNSTSSSPASLSVAKADVQVALTSSNTSPVSGEPVDFTVAVGAQAPGSGVATGTVQLKVDGNDVGSPVALAGGSAAFDPVAMTAGNHTVAVTYSGDSNFKTGSASVVEAVTKAETTTTLIATPSPSSEDQNVEIKANVAAVAPGGGSPTGTVVFTANGDVIGAGSLAPAAGGSQAVLNVSDLAPGTHTIEATYAGDAGYHGSAAAPISQVVIEGAAVVGTSTSLTSSLNPSTYGELVTFTATVVADDESAPSGAVQFSVDGTNVGDPIDVGPSGIVESPTLASPAPGDHTVIAAFVPNPGYSGSGDILTQTVADASVEIDLTSSDASSDYGQSVTFTAAVGSLQAGTDTPTGHVQFRVDGQPLGGAVALDGNGEATSVAIATLAPGAHAVTALYSGDQFFAPETAAITQSVAKVATSTTLTATPSSSTYGQAVTLTATVTPGSTAHGAPAGTVTFLDGSTTLAVVPVGAAGSNGTASLTVSNLSGGAHTVKAVYSGSPIHAASTSATSSVTVAKRATSIAADAAVVRLLPPLALPLGQLRITLTSALGPVIGAPVTFTIGSATACTTTTNADGVATCSASNQLLSLILFNGYKATYAGNGDYLGSSAQGVVLK